MGQPRINATPDEDAADRQQTGVPERHCGASGPCVEIDASTLMNGGRDAIIIHNGERYRLRVTSKQRLILTK